MQNAMVVMEPSGAHYGSYFVVERVLYDEQSEFQRILIFESEGLGRVLMLDSIFNVSTEMEAYYHEPMAHIPLAMVPHAKDVLLIGGGDFGLARELLKHQSVERLTMCELDPTVIEACRTYFPQWAAVCEADARFHLYVGDGCEYLTSCAPEAFDAIIIDSTDPALHAPMLISDAFYQSTIRSLKPGGVLMQIIADTLLYSEAWREIYPRARRHFTAVRPLFVPIPFYATGTWGLMLAAKNRDSLDPTACSEAYLAQIPDLQSLTAAQVQGWFSLSPRTRTFFEGLELEGL